MPMQFEQKFGTEAGSLKEIAAAVIGALKAGAPLDAEPSVSRRRNGGLQAMYFHWEPDALGDSPAEVAAAVAAATAEAAGVTAAEEA